MFRFQLFLIQAKLSPTQITVNRLVYQPRCGWRKLILKKTIKKNIIIIIIIYYAFLALLFVHTAQGILLIYIYSNIFYWILNCKTINKCPNSNLNIYNTKSDNNNIKKTYIKGKKKKSDMLQSNRACGSVIMLFPRYHLEMAAISGAP